MLNLFSIIPCIKIVFIEIQLINLVIKLVEAYIKFTPELVLYINHSLYSPHKWLFSQYILNFYFLQMPGN